jgi:hypothetical protein
VYECNPLPCIMLRLGSTLLLKSTMDALPPGFSTRASSDNAGAQGLATRSRSGLTRP